MRQHSVLETELALSRVLSVSRRVPHCHCQSVAWRLARWIRSKHAMPMMSEEEHKRGKIMQRNNAAGTVVPAW